MSKTEQIGYGYSVNKNQPESNQIFVFGSNLGGWHGAGSALAAMEEHGAQYGLGVGLSGHSYAIPTKDSKMQVLSLEVIDLYVQQFLDFADAMPHLEFNVVAIGCGLSGYTPEDIAPMFELSPENVNLPQEFVDVIYHTSTDEWEQEETRELQRDAGNI